MNDLIRRSDVLETYADLYDIFDDNKAIQEELHKVFDKINDIPAVEPIEVHKYCWSKEFGNGKSCNHEFDPNGVCKACGFMQIRYAVESCKDAISREWLLNELEEMNVANFYELNEHSNEMYGQMKRMIKAAPSVTVKPKQGEWIRDGYWSRGAGMGEEYGFFYKCSLCGCEVENGYTGCSFNFCPNCGARMKGVDDE